MTEPKIQTTEGFSTPTTEQLLAFGYKREEKIFVSANTGIQYRFPWMISADKVFVFVPLIIQNEDTTVSEFWIQGNMSPGQTISDADNIVATKPQLELVRFPNIMINTAPPFDRFIVAPKWCTDALAILEQIPSQYKVNQFTTIIADSTPIKTKDGRFNREQSVIPRITGTQDPEVIQKLSGIVTRKTMVDGNQVEQKIVVPGSDLTTDPATKARNIKELSLNPTNAISNTIIGRPFCVDLISKYIVTEVRQAQPQIITQPNANYAPPPTSFVPTQPNANYAPPPTSFVPTQPNQPSMFTPAQPNQQQQYQQQYAPVGFQPPPTNTFGPQQPYQQQQNAPSGFVPFVPGSQPTASYMSATTGNYVQPTQYATLDVAVNNKLQQFILVDKCNKGGESRRVDTLVKRIEGESEIGYTGFSGRFLNMSTCQLGEARTDLVTRVMSPFNNRTNQTLNLAISHSHLSEIVTGDSKGRLDEAKDGPIIDAVFREAETLIIKEIGSTTKNPEEGAMPVSLSILDIIPNGPSPAGRPDVVPKIPFAETYPVPITGVSSGITSISTPISDGKRCVPGLTVKKRGWLV